MMITSIFMNNRTQAVRLPSLYRFSEQTQKVFVRIVGVERVLSPTDKIWDSFFYSPTLKVSDDFERGEQIDSQRESFWMLKYMLDTNIAIYVIKHKPPHVRDQFNARATQLCVSSITVAELVYGA